MQLKPIVPSFRGFSALPYPPNGYAAIGSVNWHMAEGYARLDRGYARERIIQGTPTAFNKGGGAFTHVHSDGTQFPWYWFNGAIYRETGSAASSLEGSLTDTFVPAVIQSVVPAVSGFFNGTNSQARGLRKETNLALFAWDMAAPTGAFTATPSASGGALPDDEYFITIVQLDSTGVRTVASKPMIGSGKVVAFIAATVSAGGGSGSIVLDLTDTGVTFDSRAVSYRVYMGTSDSPEAMFQTGVDTAKATTTFTITSNTPGEALPHRNNILQGAELPVAGVDSAVMYQGRAVVASSTSNVWGWSEVGDLNHYYSTSTDNTIDGPITALGATEDALYIFTPYSVWQLTGDLGRNDDSTVRMKLRQIDEAVGTRARGSVVPIPGLGLFFMSEWGMCAIIGSAVQPLDHDHFARMTDWIDWERADRFTAAFNPRLRTYEVAVCRVQKTPNWLPFAAANDGINDWILRWNIDEMTMSPPRNMEVVHLSLRTMPSSPGDTDMRRELSGMNPNGVALKMEKTNGHGVEGDISVAAYNALQPSAFDPSASGSATIPDDGYGDLQGVGVFFRYITTDTAYPSVGFYRTINKSTDNGDGSYTIEWTGTLPTPSGDSPSIRIAGCHQRIRGRGLRFTQNPAEITKVDHVSALPTDEVGVESRG